MNKSHGGNVLFSPDFIKSVHNEIDALRKSKGLHPWKWKEDYVGFDKYHVSSRICECGCKESYTPTGARQKYKENHRPKIKPTAVENKKEEKPKSVHPRDNPRLDYILALRTAEKELKDLEKEIDDVDNEMEGFRAGIAGLQMVKDKAVERHLLVTESMESIKKLVQDA